MKITRMLILCSLSFLLFVMSLYAPSEEERTVLPASAQVEESETTTP